jgi:hypothetical protein
MGANDRLLLQHEQHKLMESRQDKTRHGTTQDKTKVEKERQKKE